jgi:hypothetical protein
MSDEEISVEEYIIEKLEEIYMLNIINLLYALTIIVLELIIIFRLCGVI